MGAPIEFKCPAVRSFLVMVYGVKRFPPTGPVRYGEPSPRGELQKVVVGLEVRPLEWPPS